MKPQIIELEDGSKWELATNHIRPDSNSNLVLFRFTRLPPENPMPYECKQRLITLEKIVEELRDKIRRMERGI